MTSMILRVGLWENTTGVYFHRHHLAQMEDIGVVPYHGAGFILSYEEGDRRLTLDVEKELEARSVVHIQGSSEPDVWPFVSQFKWSPPTARCEITELMFQLTATSLHCTIPLDHCLPWPRLRQAPGMDLEKIARREIAKRLESQRENNVRITLAGIPAEYQKMLTPTERVKICNLPSSGKTSSPVVA